MNGDRKLDLFLTRSATGSVAILLGNGAGGFGTPLSFPAGVQPVSVAVADFNGDKRPDFIVANTASNTGTLGFNRSR